MTTTLDNPYLAARVLVVGDMMLDRYLFGDVGRISPEAPVPIVKIDHEEDRLGGAGNVARNICAVGAVASILGIIGADDAGQIVHNLVDTANIGNLLYQEAVLKTTVKSRIVGRGQQLLRLDWEQVPPMHALEAMMRRLESALNQHQIVLLSDYGKGALQSVEQIIDQAARHHKPVLIDPKGNDYQPYRNAFLLTPNTQELAQVTGSWLNEAHMFEKAENLRQQLHLNALLVTRSEHGMTLFLNERILHEKARAQEVFDVSGAGDTVIAMMAVLLASGASWRKALMVANEAAGAVVSKLGTAVPTFNDIRRAIDQADNGPAALTTGAV